MKNLQRLIYLFLFVSLSYFTHAQKFGYVNSTLILSEHPDIKSADQQLINYQNELVAQGETKVKEFEAKYQAYVLEAQGGSLSRLQMEEKETALAQEQQMLQNFEMEVQQKLLVKREELYAPVLEKVRTALDEMGKSQGYTFIFDSSAGGILHASESDDLTGTLKSKLGM